MSNLNLDINGTAAVVSAAAKDLTVGIGSTGYLKIHPGTGTLQVAASNPILGTAATTVAGSGTIDTTQFWQRITNAGAVTSIALEAGTVHGQLLLVTLDKDAVGSVTFHATTATSRVAVASLVIAIGGGAIFIWDATDAIWCPLGRV